MDQAVEKTIAMSLVLSGDELINEQLLELLPVGVTDSCPPAVWRYS